VKFKQPASRFALVGVMVAQGASGVRVAVTGAKDCVFREPALENSRYITTQNSSVNKHYHRKYISPGSQTNIVPYKFLGA